MNFDDMSRDDWDYYNRIRRRDDGLSWLIKNLAIFSIAVATVCLLVEYL